MTGTQTVNDRIFLIYELLVFVCTAGFAAYDLRTRRVPDRGILLFCPVALMAPFLSALTHQCGQLSLGQTLGDSIALFFPVLLSSLTGAASGFLTLLVAAVFSGNGAGVGGGDIKLAAAMGFSYGVSRMLAILLTASALAVIASLAVVRRQKKAGKPEKLSLPFVPFLAAGSLAVTIAAAL